MQDELLRERPQHIQKGWDLDVSETSATMGELLRVGVHWHDLLEIVRSNSSGDVLIGGVRYQYSVGDIIVVPPEVLHGYYEHTHGKYRLYMIRLPSSLDETEASKMFERFCRESISAGVISKLDARFQDVDSVLERIDVDFKNSAYLRLRADIYNLMDTLLADKTKITVSKHTPLMKKAVEYFNANFDKDISIDDACRFLGISKFYFIRIFKQFSGETPMQYLLSIRLIKSAKLLLEGENVTQACMNSGFSGISYFIKRFKEKFGVTPKAFYLNK